MRDHPVKFGTMLRAVRLRWAYVPSRDCFFRCFDLPGNRWGVELAANDVRQLDGKSGQVYRVIDSDEEAEHLFELSPAKKTGVCNRR